MAPNYSSLHAQLLAKILAALPKTTAKKTREFVQKFYALSTIHDLEEVSPERAAAIALVCEKFYAARPKAGPKIQIAACKVEEAGNAVGRTQIIVLNDDMPFLVDSLSALFSSLGLSVHRVLHPIFTSARDRKGDLVSGAKNAKRESLIYVELSPLPAEFSTQELNRQVAQALRHVAAAVADWASMRDRVLVLAEQFTGSKAGLSQAESAEIRDLLLWLAGNHFVFLGLADYRLKGGKFIHDAATALGIYRLDARDERAIERATTATTQEALSVLKASESSLVHRHTPMDLVILRRFDAKGKCIGETRMIGLFTSTVYYRETQNIPFIRRKAARVIARAGFDPQGHSGKTLKTILEFMPRDELFQMDEDRLFQTAMGIVSLDAKPQVKLFMRPDPFARFVSSMVYVPRERFSTDLRTEILRIVEQACGGRTSSFYTQLTDSPLARLHILTETTPAALAKVDEAALERHIAERANIWADSLRDAMVARYRNGDGEALAQSFADAFPPAYTNSHSAATAAGDIDRVLECLRGDGIALALSCAPDHYLHLKCFTRDLHSELSAIIPLLEHMGCTVMDATPYVITPHAPLAPVLLRNFTLRIAGLEQLNLAEHQARIEAAMGDIWRGTVDNDALNALVFSAGLSARDVSILRAYSRYLQQLNFHYSQQLIAAALGTHAGLARTLVAMFHARFDPACKDRAAVFDRLSVELEAALEVVTNLGEDRIIRRIAALIAASLRTNFYQQENGAPKAYLSIKFRSSLIPEMPLPVPYAEIFVTSMRVEGIHLRGGAVARGGLRWSDRPEDFRTEVLGLVKAQMVKNAVIVPQGAKGGFILRKVPAEREALQAEGIACYRIFLHGLLDLTDNIVNGKLVPPTDVVRHDDDDPYLVVAADKGTATFSDIANGISAEYGFWLGDAFASGGSVGYDHKAMAITARGGWVAVERHFREMGKDIGQETFTAIGIGDMSGDVFGNGALLSKNMRLVAAFNHRHIFIDPTPDAATSYVERARLFALPRSGWNDYNATLISKGGGVFERSAKSIALTAEMRAALGVDVKSATPDELIRSILKAPVELLWNGGIGTYVKAATETHEQVGDRGNNNVRIDGHELRCAIVGEGGNLGFTQRGRIEYARKGGRINTDAIDNSGGVDCSDHEVNIKIAFGAAMAAKRITMKARDGVLKKMTEEVAELVLVDNRLQTQAISIAQGQGVSLLEPASQLMMQLESENFLNRAVEYLPDSKQLAELRSTKQGLTRPEIAVLLAYAKMAFYRDLTESPLLDAPYFEADLLRYFPKAMQKDYSVDIKAHRLRRPIVATMITNSIINRTGFAMASSLMRATGLSAADVAQAYIATRDAFGLRDVWRDIEALGGGVPASVQSQLFVLVNQFIEHSCRWFLQHVPQPMVMDEVMARYAPAVAQIVRDAQNMMSESARRAFAQTVERLQALQVPEALAQRMAMLDILTAACDIVDAARESKLPLANVGRVYFELGAVLKLGWLRASAQDLPAENYWQQLAVKSLAVEFYQAQRRLTLVTLAHYGKQADAAAAWLDAHRGALARYDAFIADLRAQATFDYPMLIVALRQVQAITSL
ncbi:MAG: NAD-glutamate dehydrogenase [Alphaproteobacteria bacterium]|nr:NAD-glutamate dehydrogenase [Alphaproteobacteria bacterium]